MSASIEIAQGRGLPESSPRKLTMFLLRSQPRICFGNISGISPPHCSRQVTRFRNLNRSLSSTSGKDSLGDGPKDLVMQIKQRFVKPIMSIQQGMKRRFLRGQSGLPFDVFHPASGCVKSVACDICQALLIEVFDWAESILIRNELQNAAESLVALVSCGRYSPPRHLRITPAVRVGGVDHLVIFCV